MTKIKTFFYILFILDILAGLIVGIFVSLYAAIATAFVLLVLNLTFYAIILKAYKQSNKVEKNGSK
ncbi:MAG: hypothetical protein LBS29_05470 [Endomicrobium sp.]|jgi:hypothetical protein|nr:hypothetical protein [Endomicrobium sp.]